MLGVAVACAWWERGDAPFGACHFLQEGLLVLVRRFVSARFGAGRSAGGWLCFCIGKTKNTGGEEQLHSRRKKKHTPTIPRPFHLTSQLRTYTTHLLLTYTV